MNKDFFDRRYAKLILLINSVSLKRNKINVHTVRSTLYICSASALKYYVIQKSLLLEVRSSFGENHINK